jgi:hypothetical protein
MAGMQVEGGLFTYGSQEAKRERKCLGFQYSLQGHVIDDLTGDQIFNTCSLGTLQIQMIAVNYLA